MDGVFAHDPLGASYAFSPLGWQGITCGFGDTETCRFTTSVKYRVDIGPFRAAALWQFGGYAQNNPSNGAYQFQIGGDISHLANGVLSLDAIYSHSRDAVAVALAGNPGPPLPFETLTATISDNTSVMLLSRYTNGPLKLYAGYEWIQYAPPSDNIFSFTDIAGNFLCAGCAAIDNTNIVNTAFSASAGFRDKIFQVVWTGAKYAVADNLDLTVAYYFNAQNSYVVSGPNAGCSSTIAPQCSGTFNALSFVADWKFAKKFDAYAGIMYSEVNKADGRWEGAYAPASRAEAPIDLQKALDNNPKASAFFAILNSRNRYAILYRIGNVKKAETRARKIAEFVAMLERGETIHG